MVLLLFALEAPLVAHAQATTVSSVDLGTVPRGVAVDSSTGYVYTLMFLNGTTLALSPQTFATAAKFPTPSPYAVAVDSTTGNVYVSQGQGASISVINGSTNSLSTTINGTGTSYALAVDEPDNLILCTDPSDGALWLVSGATDAVVARIPMGSTSALAVDPTLHEAFAGNVSSSATSGAIEVVNTTSMTLERTVEIPIPPGHFAVDPAAHLLFVTSAGAQSNGTNFLAIDDRTFQTVYSLFLGGPNQMAVASPHVFVSDASMNRLYEIDGSNGTIVMNSTQESGVSFTGITSMAFDAKSGTLFITENDVTSLIVLATGSNSSSTSNSGSATSGSGSSSTTSNTSSSSGSATLALAVPAVSSLVAAFLGLLYLRERRARSRGPQPASRV